MSHHALQCASVDSSAWRSGLAALLGATLFCVAPAFADSFSATMTVSTTVIARANLSVEAAPSTIEVSDADIARGYVDVAIPIVLRAKTNSPRGYLLQANNLEKAFLRIELSDVTTSMTVTTESWIQRPYVKGGEVISLRARLYLSAAASAGSYAWPVAFSASPT